MEKTRTGRVGGKELTEKGECGVTCAALQGIWVDRRSSPEANEEAPHFL